jgi:hypothetical protein
MSLMKVFQRKITEAQIRCALDLLLRQAGRVLTAAGVVAALAVLAQRLLAVPLLVPAALWGFWVTAGVLILILWILKLPGRIQVSLLLDERLRFHERFSTTLAEELKKLDGVAQAGEPQQVKREAIKTLGDISDKLRQARWGLRPTGHRHAGPAREQNDPRGRQGQRGPGDRDLVFQGFPGQGRSPA